MAKFQIKATFSEVEFRRAERLARKHGVTTGNILRAGFDVLDQLDCEDEKRVQAQLASLGALDSSEGDLP